MKILKNSSYFELLNKISSLTSLLEKKNKLISMLGDEFVSEVYSETNIHTSCFQFTEWGSCLGYTKYILKKRLIVLTISNQKIEIFSEEKVKIFDLLLKNNICLEEIQDIYIDGKIINTFETECG